VFQLQQFSEVTNCPLSKPESLVLYFEAGFDLKHPGTFLRGPKLPDLHLRRLNVGYALLASLSGFLSSAMALTDLSLEIDTVFGPLPETSFLACLQGTPRLHSPNPTWALPKCESSKPIGSPLQSSTPEYIASFSNLTYFRRVDHPVSFSALLAGFSAPPLEMLTFPFRTRFYFPSRAYPGLSLRWRNNITSLS